MKGKIALLDYFDGKEAAALLIDGELHDFFAEPGANAPGSIFKVKVKHQIKGSGGIFVESPDGDFFLHKILPKITRTDTFEIWIKWVQTRDPFSYH